MFNLILLYPVFNLTIFQSTVSKYLTDVLVLTIAVSHSTNYKAAIINNFKVLLRRNFDVMFITKNHLYQLIKEDCKI